nr:immunoglobulin heavy chain junction region [Mus musculus]
CAAGNDYGSYSYW